MMNVLAVYPALDLRANEMGAVWKHLADSGHAECTILASTSDRLKGLEAMATREEHPGLTIFRSNTAEWSTDSLHSLASSTRPSVIFCAVLDNLPIALRVRGRWPAPIVLHTEFLDRGYGVLRRRDFLGFPPLRPLAAAYYRNRIFRNCRAILCSDPVEFRRPGEAASARVEYLPWPHLSYNPDPGATRRDPYFSAYVGSISERKGAKVLGDFLSTLLLADDRFRVTVAGPCLDATALAAVEQIRSAGGDRAQILPSCSREHALRLISSSQFVLSPGRRLGWGLIADAWACGTPVIAASEHYDLEADKNCLLARSKEELLRTVAALQESPSLRDRLAGGGAATGRAHSVDHVADILVAALRRASALD